MGLMAVRTFLRLRVGMEAAAVTVKGIGMARPAELLIGGLEKPHRIRGMGTVAGHTGTITSQHMRMGGAHLLPDLGVTAQA